MELFSGPKRAQKPEQDEAALTVAHISCGSSHSAAVLQNGTVLTWGRGEDGQLGHGEAEECPKPTAVYTLMEDHVTAAYCGAEYTIALAQGPGTLWSWGWGDFGRLGHDDVLDVFIPRQIEGLASKQVAQVSCGDTHTCALTEAGEVFTFGRNQNGQLGNGTDSDCLSPVHVNFLQGRRVICVTAGAEHTLVATSEGEAYSWGWGRYGNLGDGECKDRWQPTKVAIPDAASRIVSVASGWRHSMCVDTAGIVYSFGWSKYGQLGHGDLRDQVLPKEVEALREVRITLISGGWRHTMAADDTGQLYGWGWNRFGQLGVGSIVDVCAPTKVTNLEPTDFKGLACGWRHTMAVTVNGEIFSWGRGVNGQLGHGDGQDSHVPRLLECLSVGTMDKAAISTAVKPTSTFVQTSDRYAVVPNDPASQLSPVPTVPTMQNTKRARV